MPSPLAARCATSKTCSAMLTAQVDLSEMASSTFCGARRRWPLSNSAFIRRDSRDDGRCFPPNDLPHVAERSHFRQSFSSPNAERTLAPREERNCWSLLVKSLADHNRRDCAPRGKRRRGPARLSEIAHWPAEGNRPLLFGLAHSKRRRSVHHSNRVAGGLIARP